jgi:hypothetical protein
MTAVTQGDGVLIITARSPASTANCPRCEECSQRIRRYDTRRSLLMPRNWSAWSWWV